LELQGTGESLLSEDLEDILSAARKYRCSTTLITNAFLLSKENFLLLAKSSCRIVISLDSIIDETYRAIRVNGDLSRVSNNLSYWKFIKNNLPIDCDSSLGINMVLCSLNYNELIPMIDYAVEVGASYLFVSEIRHCIPCQEMWEKLTLENIKLSEEFSKIIDSATSYALSKELPINFNFRKAISNCHKKNICISPWEHIFIDADGNLSVCCALTDTFGNLNNQNFISIWDGEKINKFRSNMALGMYYHDCKTCCLSWGITNR
jgi:MoaA/NifB/PqqE/SkfB family radical SAM enzyme